MEFPPALQHPTYDAIVLIVMVAVSPPAFCGSLRRVSTNRLMQVKASAFFDPRYCMQNKKRPAGIVDQLQSLVTLGGNHDA
jgi:hypothetical protein